ncbi:MAG: sorbosone dehydrogenase family protein [Chitinophagaceae bacterium]|nr:sorbosone dehydrogenase family protein [Chitinophagaceae bacterium]
MISVRNIIIGVVIFLFHNCSAQKKDEFLGISSLILPKGFTISVYAQNVVNARSMVMGTNGMLFVGSRDEGKVYGLKDTDGDFIVDTQYTIATGLKMPNGVAFKDGSLYVAEVSKLWRYDAIESRLLKSQPLDPKLIYDDYPTDRHHGWKYIAFGPDGKLYIPVGAPCNICESKNEIYATITRMNADATGREIVARGVRNTVGFTWHPKTKELWFTDNGGDNLGDDIPSCELNKVSSLKEHFGYPYCHEGEIADPEYGGKFPCSDFTTPMQKLGAHVAPLGLKFYTGKMFPQEYYESIFIAEHGSWNRSKKSGYRITNVKLQNGKAISYKPFIYGWLDESTQEAWGRPVDVLVLPDGSMLISDDKANCIYRVTYSQ